MQGSPKKRSDNANADWLKATATAPMEPRNDDLYSEIATGQKPFAMTIVMKRLYYSAVLRKIQPSQQENSYIVNVYGGKI